MTDVVIGEFIKAWGVYGALLAAAVPAGRAVWKYATKVYFPAKLKAIQAQAEATRDQATAMGNISRIVETILDKQETMDGKLNAVGEDVAGIYGSMRQPRPSRQRKEVGHAPA